MPFIVLFCHAIETCDPTHLENLAAVVETVHILPADIPDVYKKQLRLFKLMYDVACKYIDSRASNPPMHPSGRIPDTPLGMLFTEAGMPLPNHLQTQTSTQVFQDGTGQGTGLQFCDLAVGQDRLAVDSDSLSHNADLGSWFDQNQQIFNLLDDNM